MSDDMFERPEEYSVGPLDDNVWWLINEMCRIAIANVDAEKKGEYRYAREQFLLAHPDEAFGESGVNEMGDPIVNVAQELVENPPESEEELKKKFADLMFGVNDDK